MKKNRLFFVMFILTSMLFITITNARAATTWQISDELYDVTYWSNGTLIAEGNYDGSIDFEKIFYKGSDIELLFQAEPQDSEFHYYEAIITWDTYLTYKNYSQISFGGLGGDNEIRTFTIGKNGIQILVQTVYDRIEINGDSLICPLIDISYIQDKIPEEIVAVADHRSDPVIIIGNYYFDTVNGTDISTKLPGFTTPIALASFISIFVLIFFRKKK
ncbi:MAG TPA: hypothetical protein VMZ29_13005 [Candidatus Bathyarchaeia archaeon]|nr:hypothetical protein [Candidatus Bathyarchaeia archaeon]